MLTTFAVRLASRRIVTSRTFASVARVAAKDETSVRQLVPLLAAAGLAVAGTALYREVGHESPLNISIRLLTIRFDCSYLYHVLLTLRFDSNALL